MYRDRLITLIAFAEIIPLEHTRNRMRSSELYHAGRAQFIQPCGIKNDLGLLWLKYLEDLLGVRLGILLHLLSGQWRARGAFACRVADHSGEITDQEKYLVPQILELA